MPPPQGGNVTFIFNFPGFMDLYRLVVVRVGVWGKKKPQQRHNFHNPDSNDGLGVWV